MLFDIHYSCDSKIMNVLLLVLIMLEGLPKSTIGFSLPNVSTSNSYGKRFHGNFLIILWNKYQISCLFFNIRLVKKITWKRSKSTFLVKITQGGKKFNKIFLLFRYPASLWILCHIYYFNLFHLYFLIQMFTSFKRQIKRTIKSRDLRIFTRHFSSRAQCACGKYLLKLVITR